MPTELAILLILFGLGMLTFETMRITGEFGSFGLDWQSFAASQRGVKLVGHFLGIALYFIGSIMLSSGGVR